ncbi:N-acetyltransferase [Anaerocolumna cellulosilytica]|uniref:N-acetyltransferase n=1 Tax=Anaerocolumna cellulosilytica TaxID=433286 RepID=A0A6S6R4S9_9FIRM|nr:GNAT family N-acetyltransferase [Anaerocolumna cellulosilytica]MBB5198059.1 GNAT superfamily N-acetyltransferase [Anaerocolumna cellulosilytica]BCJ95077.1 N-acetyltransferase [Anaerocolumna cellulosilytica]
MNIQLKHQLTVAEYNDIRKSAGWLTLSEVQAERGLKNTYYLVAAVHDDKAIAMARVISDGGYVVYISDVIVNPSYQGYGIGKLMMEDIMNFLKSDIAKEYPVMINLMAAVGKENFYEKFGFKVRPSEDTGAGMSQWLNL